MLFWKCVYFIDSLNRFCYLLDKGPVPSLSLPLTPLHSPLCLVQVVSISPKGVVLVLFWHRRCPYKWSEFRCWIRSQEKVEEEFQNAFQFSLNKMSANVRMYKCNDILKNKCIQHFYPKSVFKMFQFEDVCTSRWKSWSVPHFIALVLPYLFIWREHYVKEYLHIEGKDWAKSYMKLDLLLLLFPPDFIHHAACRSA